MYGLKKLSDATLKAFLKWSVSRKESDLVTFDILRDDLEKKVELSVKYRPNEADLDDSIRLLVNIRELCDTGLPGY